jgi:hypothetical protein
MLLIIKLKVVTIGQVTDNNNKKKQTKKGTGEESRVKRRVTTSQPPHEISATVRVQFRNENVPLTKKKIFFSCNLVCEIRRCFKFVTDRLLFCFYFYVSSIFLALFSVLFISSEGSYEPVADLALHES